MRVLISGATGLVGTKVAELCQKRGVEVNYLTRNKKKIKHEPGYKGFYWNPEKGEIDDDCVKEVDAVINLAGANIASPWTKSYKKKILSSRIDSLNLLFNTFQKKPNRIRQIVSASAIGIYPSSFSHIYEETDTKSGQSFLSDVVRKWESTTDEFSKLGMEVTKIRTGLVLSEKGGVFPIMKKSVNNYMGAIFGDGKQWQSWIHIEDLANIYLYAVDRDLDGVYNAVAPNPVNNKKLTRSLAKRLNRPLWLPKIPSFVFKTILGERAELILSSQLVSSNKIQQMGFRFQYSNIHKAFDDLV